MLADEVGLGSLFTHAKTVTMGVVPHPPRDLRLRSDASQCVCIDRAELDQREGDVTVEFRVPR